MKCGLGLPECIEFELKRKWEQRFLIIRFLLYFKALNLTIDNLYKLLDMFVIHGGRAMRIKKTVEDRERCNECKAFGMNIEVFRKYYHVWFIPFVAYGPKVASVRCSTCGEAHHDKNLNEHHEQNAKTPFYYYSGAIILAGLIALLVMTIINDNKKEKQFADSPQKGDVYGLKSLENGKAIYSFMKVSGINGDTVFTYHSKYQYDGFVSKLSKEDYFVKDDELFFLKKEIKMMHDSGEIHSINRNYSDNTGFFREQ